VLKNIGKWGGYPDEYGKNWKIGKYEGWVVEIWWKKNAELEQKRVGGCFFRSMQILGVLFRNFFPDPSPLFLQGKK
jgi:hypothetical protein